MTEKPYISLEDQYQTVNVRKNKDELTSTNTVEEILKKIVPAKSFLYRNHDKNNERIFSSYLPMDTGTPKKPKRFFRMSSYEYPNIFGSKTTKTENFNDRGYYSVKTNSRYYIQKTFKIPAARNKYKSITTPEDISDVVMEDHFYEDLCYNDVEKVDEDKKDPQKPYKVKIQELFQSFKLPFFKKSEEVVEEAEKEKGEVERDKEKVVENDKESNFYENGDVEVASNMYDSVHVPRPVQVDEMDRVQIPVEDYLEPIQVERERQYCDVALKEDSLLQYIMSLFENFGMRRGTMCWWCGVASALVQNLCARLGEASILCCFRVLHCLTDAVTETNEDHSDDSDVSRKQPSSPEGEAEWKPNKTNMADRPLPVPVENEPYYMNIDRCEAENLLKGEADGTFILRPSSQPNHAYTLTVSCAGVHNVGVRRRPDGRLALGYPRRGERSFPSVGDLLRHHRRRRLLLVAGGGVVGATTLNEPPRYYQTPSSLPVPLRTQ